MKITKITQSLLLVSVFAIVLDLARLDAWGTTDLLFLIWNLFLAWIPYLLSLFFIKKDMAFGRFLPLFILWLIFLPNAPYLITDVLHVVTSQPMLLWYDSLLLFLFGWLGLLLGTLSLFQVHQYLQARLHILASELVIFIVCFVSSFGVYLGRFLRFNSWDIFINPFELMRHSLGLSAGFIYPRPFTFVVILGLFTYFTYRTIYTLIENKEV